MFQFDLKQHGEENEQRKTLAKEVGEVFGERDAGALDVVDDRGNQAAGGLMLEESDGLANDAWRRPDCADR